ncbi:MAG TPA: hypothetical protein VFU21_01405, partial [Kofleriaceae bacterium]|nr:hypothetical protein [Kofleriaceae bacterium]
PAPADRVRHAVVSHPYTDDGSPASSWEVLSIDVGGELAATGTTFAMGRATGGSVAFTPDGAVGVAAQEDGTLGVFTLSAGGEVEVIEAGWRGAMYAGAVVPAPDGAGVYVLDSQWRENGGGVYRVDIDCDGRVQDGGLVAAARLPYAMVFAGGGARALAAASDILDSGAGEDVHLVDLGAREVVAGADPFPDDEQIVASAALTADGAYLLVGDNNQFYSSEELENRVAVVRVDGASLAAVQTLPVEDPIAIAASPFDDAAVVVSGFGDAIVVLSRDDRAAKPFARAGEVDYTGPAPQLPGAIAAIERGALRGHLLVAELLGVRHLAFTRGAVIDHGLLALGDGTAAITGALGLQP